MFRINQIDEALQREWVHALITATGETEISGDFGKDFPILSVALLTSISNLTPIWDSENNVDVDLLKTYTKRMLSLLPASLDQFYAKLKPEFDGMSDEMTEEDAAITLIVHDRFFPDDQFDVNLFNAEFGN